MRNTRVTINDIASRAGVSYQTVSRVINNRPDVADDTRARVQQIINEVGYRPSAAARSLVSHRTHTLGLLTADFSDYFFTQVIIGAEAEARKHSFHIMLGSTERNPEEEPEYFRMLAEQQVEGILFARPSTEPDNGHIQSMLRQGIPVVTTAYHAPGEGLTVVDVDNVDGGIQAARCLVEAGHRRIAMITGPGAWRSVADRAQGYQLALEAAGIGYDPTLVAQGDWSYESGYRAMAHLLDAAPGFTGLFAQNDQMAIGAIRALHDAGWRVPDDLGVVGYDDIPVARYYQPRLTTIHQPMQEVGRMAARLLIEAIDNRSVEQKEVLLKPELLRRESCGGMGNERRQSEPVDR